MVRQTLARTIVQHELEVMGRQSVGEPERVTVRGTVLEIPNEKVLYGLVELGASDVAMVWRRVLKESGHMHKIVKGSKVECVIRYRSNEKPIVTNIKLAPVFQGAKQL